VNLLAAGSPADADRSRHIVPEFVPWYVRSDAVSECAVELLRHPERLAEQRRRLSELIGALDHPGASTNVARLALEMMDRPT
jgi:hypothetical protein